MRSNNRMEATGNRELPRKTIDGSIVQYMCISKEGVKCTTRCTKPWQQWQRKRDPEQLLRQLTPFSATANMTFWRERVRDEIVNVAGVLIVKRAPVFIALSIG